MKATKKIIASLKAKGYSVEATEMEDATKRVIMLVARKNVRIKYMMINQKQTTWAK